MPKQVLPAIEGFEDIPGAPAIVVDIPSPDPVADLAAAAKAFAEKMPALLSPEMVPIYLGLIAACSHYDHVFLRHYTTEQVARMVPEFMREAVILDGLSRGTIRWMVEP